MNKKVILGMLLSSVITYSFAQQNDMQEGYNYQSQKINNILEEKSSELDKVYDFEKMSENGKTVPSLVCTEDTVKTYNGIKLEKSEVCNIKYKSRSIYKNETTKELLTWRDFLIMPIGTKLSQYKDNAEFKKGIEKANQKALDNIMMIKEMYMGMMVYKDFQSQGIISDSVKNDNTMKLDKEKNLGEKNE